MGCPHCGHENQPGARFCANPSCGRYLAVQTPPTAVPLATPSAPQAETSAAPLPGTNPTPGAGPGTPVPVEPVASTAATAAGADAVQATPFDPPGFGGVAGTTEPAPPSTRQAAAARPQASYTFSRARVDPVQVTPVEVGGPVTEATSAGSRSADKRHGLFVVFDQNHADVAAGGECLVPVRIANTGVIVERVDLRAEGLPPGWVTFEPAQVNLDQNQEETVLMRIRPPRSVDTAAGRTPYALTVWSLTDPTVRVSLGATLTVLPFAGARVVLDPTSASARRSATFTATVINDGNAPLVATVEARVPTQGTVRVHPPSQPATVGPGASVTVPFHATAKRWLWTPPTRKHPITFAVTDGRGLESEAQVVLIQSPVLPSWVIKAMAIVSIVLVLLGALGVKKWLDIRPRPVPNVVHTPADDAKAKLAAAGFGDTTVNQAPADAAAGTVVAQDPEADSFLGGGEPVTITVSTGPAPTSVPNVQGLTVDDAKAKLAALGFKPVVDKPITDPAPKDHVAKQNPLPDAPATAGAVVTLTPSAGAETVAVPDLSRKTREEVNSTLQQLGLTLTIGTERAPADATAGAAFKQNPPAGTKVAKGSAVTVSFAPEATTTTTAGGGANGGGGSGGGGGGGGGSKGTTALPAPKPPG